jgi:hypothetical protein
MSRLPRPVRYPDGEPDVAHAVESRSLAAEIGRSCHPPDPWSTSVTFTGSGVLTIIASTGGHLHQVARFAPAFLPTRARQINLVRSAFGGGAAHSHGSEPCRW